MRKGITIRTAVLLGLLSLGSAGLAQEAGQWRHGFGEGGFGEGGFGGRMRHARFSRLLALLDDDRVKVSLNLTDAQADRLRQIAVETEKSTLKSGADLAVRGIELRELLGADKPDREAVMKKIQEISNLRAELMKQHVAALLDAKSVLTPEQQKKIRTFMEGRRGSEIWRHRPEGFRPGVPGKPPAPPERFPHPAEPPVE